MIVDASSRPPTIGSLRARFADPVRFSSRSETWPPTSTPIDAAMYGSIVIMPAFMKSSRAR